MSLIFLAIFAFFVLLVFLAWRWKPGHLFLKVLRILSIPFYSLFMVGFGLLAGTMIWMEDPWYLRTPSDKKLISVFYEHRDTFEKLNRMAQEDAGHGYYFSGKGYSRKKVLSESRTREYQTLLREIGSGIDMEVEGWSPSTVEFVFSTTGFFESSRGIEFIPWTLRDNRKTAKFLDNSQDPEQGEYCRPIKDKWFIFHTSGFD